MNWSAMFGFSFLFFLLAFGAVAQFALIDDTRFLKTLAWILVVLCFLSGLFWMGTL